MVVGLSTGILAARSRAHMVDFPGGVSKKVVDDDIEDESAWPVPHTDPVGAPKGDPMEMDADVFGGTNGCYGATEWPDPSLEQPLASKQVVALAAQVVEVHEAVVAALQAEVRALRLQVGRSGEAALRGASGGHPGEPREEPLFVDRLSSAQKGNDDELILDELGDERDASHHKLHDHWEKVDRSALVWCITHGKRRSGLMSHSPKFLRPSTMGGSYLSVPVGSRLSHISFEDQFMSRPGSKPRVLWDMIAMVLVLYDAITMPLGAFSLPRTTGFAVMEWVTRAYWTLDIPMTFTVGQFIDGEVIMDPCIVAKNYSKGSFALDLLIVGSDWLVVFIGTDSTLASNAGILRIFRAARILRLVRLLKLQKILLFLQDTMNSEHISLFFDFAKLMFVVIFTSHLAACGYWFLGLSHKGSWIDAANMYGAPLDEQYLFSLYACLMTLQMETGMQNQNTGEYVYCICLVIVGLVLFSFIVSRITTLLIEINALSSGKSQEVWRLRRFFRQKRVPLDLSRRITRYLEYHYEQKRVMVQWSELPILDNLTPVLRSQLRYVGYMQNLREHALFRFVEHVSDVTMQRLCERALSEKALAERDPLFFQDELSGSMEILVRGILLYAQRAPGDKIKNQEELDWENLEFGTDRIMVEMTGSAICSQASCFEVGTRPSSKPRHSRVLPDAFLSESALWVQWRYLGSAYALTECTLITVDVVIFGEVAKRSVYMQPVLAAYAAMALKNIKSLYGTVLLSDLWDKHHAEMILQEVVHDATDPQAPDGEDGSRSSAEGKTPRWKPKAPRLTRGFTGMLRGNA